jgi:DNA-binding SARP family transcriptional activator
MRETGPAGGASTSAPDGVYRFEVLGRLSLRAPDGSELKRVLSGDLRLALLTYLALGMPAARRRDSLMALLWPEADSDEARHRLRQSLYVLRGELGADVLVTAGREQVGLDPAKFWCDAVELVAALARGDDEAAQALYAGPLCEGLFVANSLKLERWLDEKRESLQQQVIESAWRLADRAAEEKRLRDAVTWGMRALDLSPDEDRLRWLIRQCDRAGDKVTAIRIYDRFARMLAAEYEILPGPESRALILAVRNGAAPPVAAARRPPGRRLGVPL